MITHILALYWLARPQPKAVSALIGRCNRSLARTNIRIRNRLLEKRYD
jgi:hypothetical protein